MTGRGQRIIDGLKEAIAGDFAAVTIEGQRWVRADKPEAASLIETIGTEGMVTALKELEQWCIVERGKLGAIDGYDYRSGEEYGLRRAEVEVHRRICAMLAAAPSAISSSPLPPAGRDYTDFGVDANDPESAIAAELDNGPDAARIMRVLNDLGFVIVRQPLASPPVPVGEPDPFHQDALQLAPSEGMVEALRSARAVFVRMDRRGGFGLDVHGWIEEQIAKIDSILSGKGPAPSVGDELVKALTAILREPYGCVFCDSGVLRDPKKSHRDDCGYTLARKALGLREGEAP